MSETITGAQSLVYALEAAGVTDVFGIPGGAILPLYDPLYNSKIRHILVRHEQGAGFIAQGMARATGRAAVCVATSGPGATNLLTAIADARMDSVPLVAITGQVPQALIGTDAFQEVDTYGLTVPITKHNFLVRSPAELLEAVPLAFQIAESGRPGPVLIDLPKDVQNAAIEVADADLLLHVVDAGAYDITGNLRAVREVLAEVGAGDLPEQIVLNKIDRLDELGRRRVANRFPGSPMVSAVTGEGLEELRGRIAERFASRTEEVQLLVPYGDGARLSELYALGAPIDGREDTAEGVLVHARLPRRDIARFAAYLIADDSRDAKVTPA